MDLCFTQATTGAFLYRIANSTCQQASQVTYHAILFTYSNDQSAALKTNQLWLTASDDFTGSLWQKGMLSITQDAIVLSTFFTASFNNFQFFLQTPA